MSWIKRNLKVVVPVSLVGLAVGGWLFFGVFAFHLEFIDDEVAESGPVFDSGVSASGLDFDEVSDETAAGMTDAMANEPIEVPAADEQPAMTGEIVTLFDGSFIDRSHPTSGTALVLNDGTEQRFLRFEDFATDNGPDLDVYLTTAGPDASTGEIGDDFISLGDLKGNVGPQNYEIPADVDLDEYGTVVIWCTRFSVAFGAAALVAG